MPRRKISEYRSKKIIHEALSLPYAGWEIEVASIASDLKAVKGFSSYVVKVDQAVKGRFKKGLVVLDVRKTKIQTTINKMSKQGYSHFIVEPYIRHENGQEQYLSISHDRSGLTLNTSRQGGVDIEQQADSIRTYGLSEKVDWEELAAETGIKTERLKFLVNAFHENHFVFLEINPYLVINDGKLVILDAAVEVDDAASFLISKWSESDIRHAKNLVRQESIVRALDEGSVASFNLSVINSQGSIFLLLSGGGASIVVADEVYNQGYGKQLANYGEYSGNPSFHETEKYTSQVLELLLESNASEKVLFIGGAVANFTDIAVTFSGIIAAINAYATKLAKHNVKVYVRRGGPNQEEGLENMREALGRHNILGAVHDASMPITDALSEALKGLKK
jgi:ATP-citrate lyase beta-subunit